MTDFLEKTFRLKEHQTDVRTEILAGITTFMTMAYILAVNPGILSAAGMDAGAVFTATALGACLGTLLMALFSNYPFALAPGMGLNAFFAYTVVGQMGYSWQVALAAVVDTLPLNICGLMSSAPAEELIGSLDEIAAKAHAQGVLDGIDPFISLSFMALPIIPKLRITDMGMFDTEEFEFIK